MTTQKPNPFQNMVLKLAATRPAAWLLSGSLHRIDRLCLRCTGGRVSMTSLLTGLPVVHVTTTGAKSGLPRSTPLLCIRDEAEPRNLVLIATNFGQERCPAWYFNLKAHPQAACSIGGDVQHYLAHEACDDEYARLWQLAARTYAGYAMYKQRIHGRRVPVIVMTPVQ
jgi:deazaflavin-dependent oxidoreductase (nitroreductase family)